MVGATVEAFIIESYGIRRRNMQEGEGEGGRKGEERLWAVFVQPHSSDAILSSFENTWRKYHFRINTSHWCNFVHLLVCF